MSQFNRSGSFISVLLFYLHITLIGCKSLINGAVDVADFSVSGFASGVTGGGIIPEFSPLYKHVYNAQDLHDALMDPSTKVIEIMNDLDLGYFEIPETLRDAGIYVQHRTPLAHPKLLQTGVSRAYIRNRNNANGNPGLTIFSDKGVTIRHCNLDIRDVDDLVMRNLRFDELWEWDDATSGDYDRNDWDYITVRNAKGVWFDHLELNRVYDGILDIHPDSERITISYLLTHGAHNGTDSFYVEQFDYLEANRNLYPKYDYLRETLGISQEDIMYITSPQKKGHLIGAQELHPLNHKLSLTIHNSLYIDLSDRMPRLRAGNAHVFNVISDFRVGQEAKRHREKLGLPSDIDYKFQVTSNGVLSTENGALLVENTKLLEVTSPIRNNQKDANNPAFTGKILARNVHHTLRGNFYTGTSVDPGSTLVPYPAKDIPFSWNGFTTLPYTYSLIELDDLDLSLSGPLTGAGVKDLGWDKENWLRTVY